MAKVGRNEPCSCGSGRKAKRCCGISRGPGEHELARSFLTGEAVAAAYALAGVEDDDLDVLWRQMLRLPQQHLALHFPLPRLVTPGLRRLIDAFRDDDDDEAEDALDEAVARLDTPALRAALARKVLDLSEAGLVRQQVAAVAILDLAADSQALVRSSLVEAAAVAAGTARTPGGLVVADRLAA